jgi:DNA-binding IclR family transcriptional regulator
VAQARRRGWAANREEWIPGLSVLAAPIRVADGSRLAAVVAVAASAPRMRALGEAEVAKRTLAAAARIAARLQGRVAA